MVKVYETDGSYVASEGGCWIPGSYTCAKSARLSAKVDPVKLSKAWEAKRGSDGVIRDEFTLDEIKALLEATNAKAN